MRENAQNLSKNYLIHFSNSYRNFNFSGSLQQSLELTNLAQHVDFPKTMLHVIPEDEEFDTDSQDSPEQRRAFRKAMRRLAVRRFFRTVTAFPRALVRRLRSCVTPMD